MDPRRELGNSGEQKAIHFFEAKGWKIVATQYRTPVGEIDLVALDGQEVVFVEVKTRRSLTSGYPEESVTRRKRRHMAAAAHLFLLKKGWQEKPYRLDVLAIIEQLGKPDDIQHFEAVDAA